MATKPTILKASLQVSDLDRGYYGTVSLTISQQPSETDERTMVRLLAFALHASEELRCTEGIAAQDEPDIWSKNRSGEIEEWIEVGLPSEKRIRKACNQAEKVSIYAYGARTAPVWWESVADDVRRHRNLEVFLVPAKASRPLASLAKKTMTLQITIQEGQVWISDGEKNVAVEPTPLHPLG